MRFPADYNYDGSLCVNTQSLRLGDYCDGAPNERHVANAGCYRSNSVCYPGYMPQGNSCVYKIGYPCASYSDCGGDNSGLMCENAKCTCSIGGKRQGNQCVPSEFPLFLGTVHSTMIFVNNRNPW